MGSVRSAPTGLLAVLCLLGLLFGPAQAAERSCPAATGKTFSGDYTDQNFSSMPAGSLIGANFQNAVLKGAIFIGQDLSGASFYNAKLGPSSKGSADFTNATLTGTCFIKATLDATDVSFAKMTCTDFSSTSLLKANFGPLQSISSGANCRTRFNASMIDIHAIALANWGLVD